MPSFAIETVLSVLGPRYELTSLSNIDAMTQKVLGRSSVEDSLKRIQEHILKHYPALEDYHEYGTRIYVSKFKENSSKMIKHYRKEFGERIEIPVYRNIVSKMFRSMDSVTYFVGKNLLESDIVSIQMLTGSELDAGDSAIVLFYWERP